MVQGYSHPGPVEILDYFASGVHTGRGNGLDKAIGYGFISDFGQHSAIQAWTKAGRISFKLFAKVGPSDRNIDLVVGPVPQGMDIQAAKRSTAAQMIEQMPATVYLGAEFKSIMTEHGKNQRNRRKDMDGHATDMKNLYPNGVSIGLCVVNASDRYFSYTAGEERQYDGRGYATRALAELHGAQLRSSPRDSGLDILCTPVVDVANNSGHQPSYYKAKPAPPDGSKHSWNHMVEEAATRFAQRFGQYL